MSRGAKKESQIDAMRHTLAHILMQALVRLYKAKPGIGPAIENGFYHDFDATEKISLDDLKKIEKEMRKIIKENFLVVKEIVPIDDGIAKLEKLGYDKTLELAKELKEKGEKELSFYSQGEFVNMCEGPHVGATGEVGAFKLSKISGAYWRGNEANDMQQRIYGVAFESQEALDGYLTMMEEAEKRDHRKLGKELDLFVFSDLVGAGLPLWTPKGQIMREEIDRFVQELRKEKGYVRVEIPHITKKELYETSGHWEKFKDDLFKLKTREGHEYVMKPMNCPHHTQIYARTKWSYRDLPQRYANTTMVYRDEQSGELSGLSRVLSITQDDAHVFCRKDQVKEEFMNIWEIIEHFYSTFGFSLTVRLSFHDPDNFSAYLGTPALWKEAEHSIREIAKEKNVTYLEAQGEAAFYGPKIDFMAKDSIGREWQVATIQLDINMPERFNLFCIDESGNEERIVMIHAAITGSLERFLSVIIEHYAGAFPTWFSPEQVRVVTVSDKFNEYALGVKKALEDKGVRVSVDDSNESLGKKIRNGEKAKTPYLLIVGEKEVADNLVAVRKRGVGDTGAITVGEFEKMILEEIRNRK